MGENTNYVNLRVGHLNTRSVISSFVDFSNLMIENLFDVMMLTESWLTPNIPDDVINIVGYRLLRCDRNSGRGGGVAIYISNKLNFERIDIETSQDLNIEQLWISLNLKNSKLGIGAIYRPPQSNITHFIEAVDTVLSNIVPTYEKIIIAGDVNVNLFNLNNQLTNLLDSYGFFQVINEPTRVTQFSSTLLDPIYVNDLDMVINSGTINADHISDHRLVFCNINIFIFKSKQKMYTYRNFKHINHNEFQQDLNNIPWQNIIYIDDISRKVDFLTSNILRLFDNHAPIRTVRMNKPPAPWLTDTLRRVMKDRDNAFTRYKQSKTIDNWNHYRTMRNFASAAIRREKAAFLKFTNEGDVNQLWKKLKIMNIQTKKKIDIPENLQNPTSLNNYFLTAFNTDSANDQILSFYNSRKFNTDIKFSFQLVTPEVIEKIVSKMKSNASGHDEISLQMLRLCMPVIKNYVTHIINCCLERGFFPMQWKISIVSPIPKNNSPKALDDLRPISLLCILSKILEKVVNFQLTQHFNNYKLLSENQSGFRAGHSTCTTLLNILDVLVRALDERLSSILVLLDFSKAFDSVDHNLLIAKLHYYGLDNMSLLFFRSYLENRRQIVRTNLGMSSSKLVSSGVPQGSILGPFLFLVYTSDIYSVTKFSEVHCYADDTQLIYTKFSSQEYELASRNINEDLCKIVSNCKSHKLKLNSQKTAIMLFCPKHEYEHLKSNLNIALDGERLSFIEKAKNLGITIDINLRFNDHVNNLIKKSYVSLKLLYANKHILNYKTRKKLCETIVLPIFFYADIVYYPCLDFNTKNRIQIVQNTCCRFVNNLRKFDHITEKFRQLNWLNMNNNFEYHLLTFVHRLLITSIPIYLRKKLLFRDEIHSRDIRHIQTLTMPNHSTAIFRRSFSYNAVHLYNNVDHDLKKYSLNTFKFRIKSNLLQSQ